MSKRKKRVLWVGEASYLNSGFSTYSHEVLSRLYDSGKYELLELGAFSDYKDIRAEMVSWPFMHNCPNPNSQSEINQYYSLNTNKYGEWKFEEACLRIKPDVVCDCRDWWMLEFEERSPFRPYFHWAIMPTVDAEPQDEAWISTYLNADAVFTYSDWGLDQLTKQSRGKIKTKCSAPPGADLALLHPKSDRREHRRKLGMDEDCFIVGTIMRNQRRKLYPNLIQAFAKFLKTAPEEIARRTYLYLHTYWPDVGWDIPKLINEAGINSRCVLTYLCRNCGVAFPSFFQDALTTCRTCGDRSAFLANSHMGVSRKVLCEIINSFDVYVQYANSEGFGMPQVEAAACGVPVMAVDYSAMSDVVRKLRGFPIKVKSYYREPETHCWRAIPDDDDLVSKLIDFFKLPESVRANHRFNARRSVEQYYTYDKTAKIWMDHIDSLELVDDSQTWCSPAKIFTPNLNIPPNLTDDEFVRWGILNIAGRPDLLNHYMALRMTRDLNWGAAYPQTGGIYFNEDSQSSLNPNLEPFNREMCAKSFLAMCAHRNHWEQIRSQNNV